MTQRGDATGLSGWVPELDTEVWDRYPLWTSANAGEVLPGVMTPLTISTIALSGDHGFIYLFDLMEVSPVLGIDGSREQYFLGTFFGRAHLNLSLIRAGADLLPGSSAEAIDEQYLGQPRDPNAPPRQFTAEQEAFRKQNAKRLEIEVPRHIQYTIENEQRVAAYVATQLKTDLAPLSDADLVAAWDDVIERARRCADLHLFNRAMESPTLEDLAQFVAAVTGREDAGLVARLCTGLADLESAKPAHAIWRLSRRVAASDALRAIFEGNAPSTVLPALRSVDGSDAAAFVEELDAFLDQYGYRGERELELSMPGWRDEPAFVISSIQNYLRMTSDDPGQTAERQARAREEARRTVEALLDEEQKAQFEQALQLAHVFTSHGELTKSQWVRMAAAAKDIVREMSRRLVDRRLLAAGDDVYFLKIDELLPLVVGGERPADLDDRIARRRDDYERQQEIELPEWFEGRPVPITPVAPTAAPPEKISGIPVSPGVVRGRARVIMSVAGGANIEEGEILIAPYTDAPWTPLFFTAAGLVCDLGGPLSHGSIVAREYGIPAVTNTKTGTKVIATGDWVTIDGSTGEVTIERVTG